MKNYSRYFKLLALSLSVGLGMNTSLPVIASIKDRTVTESSSEVADTLTALGFKVPGVRYSRRRTGGLSRSSKECNGEFVSTTPLWPNLEENEGGPVAVESTVNSNPTFFVHLSHESPQEAEFVVFKEEVVNNQKQQQIIHEEFLELSSNPTGDPQIVALSLPNDPEKQLEVGQYYHWIFSVICDPDDNSKNPVADGWVQRIPQDEALTAELAGKQRRDYPDVYAERGIWTDSLMVLADLRKQYPNDLQLKEKWETLLKSVGLDEAVAAQNP